MYIVPTICTALIVLSAILMTVGIRHIIKGNIPKHEQFMKLSALAALGFFILYVSRTLLVGNTSFGGPDSLAPVYTTFLIFHIILATTSAFLGGYQLYLGSKKHIAKYIKRHMKLGKIVYVMWMATAVTGVMVYVILYILYTGETTSMWDAIFNN